MQNTCLTSNRLFKKIAFIGIIIGLAFVVAMPPTQLMAKPKPTSIHSEAEKSKTKNESDASIVALTPERMYRYLVMMLNLQEARYPQAFDDAFFLAQDTRDPSITQLAMQLAIARPLDSKSLAIARTILSLRPDDRKAQQYLLSVAIANQNLDVAKTVIHQMIANVPKRHRGSAIFSLQQELSKSGIPSSEFTQILKSVVETFPSPEASLALALQFEAIEEKDKALKTIEPSLRWPSTQIPAILLVSRVAPLEEALKSLESFLKSKPHLSPIRGRYIELLNQAKRYKDIPKQLTTFLRYDPKNANAILIVAENELQKGNLDAAERLVKPLIQRIDTEAQKGASNLTMQPDLVNRLTAAYRLMIGIDLARKNYTAAQKWIHLIEPLDTNSALIAKIDILLLTNQYDKAFSKALKFGAQRYGDEQQALFFLPVIRSFLNNNQVDYAQRLINQLQPKTLDSEEGMLLRAQISDKRQDYKTMEKVLRDMIRLYPKNPESYNYLGYFFADRNERLDEAEKLLKQSIALAPEATHIIDSIGWLLYRQGKLSEAKNWLKRAWLNAPHEPELIAHYVEVLWVSGDKGKANRLLKNALKRHPKHEALKSLFIRIQKAVSQSSNILPSPIAPKAIFSQTGDDLPASPAEGIVAPNP